MYYFRSLLFLTTVCLIAKSIGDHRNNSLNCIERVRWDQILMEIEKLNSRGFPLPCKDMDNKDLCVPEQIVKLVKHNIAAVVQIVHEIAGLFNTTDIPFPNPHIFLKDMYETHEHLRTCLPSSLFNIRVVKDCFKKMNKLTKSNSQCGWQEVHAQSREILQRIENYTLKRKRTY